MGGPPGSPGLLMGVGGPPGSPGLLMGVGGPPGSLMEVSRRIETLLGRPRPRASALLFRFSWKRARSP
ncbi:hypothetical protein Pph01_70430 [Planotetraspora phitsanulokensis]|uniref:Uncharacterized protein n=1 Tax=Planotetraspora phitsanulokensis TaxID=575192 RepID=A0A8J3UC16_9ACTN|nr:hypothetical protein Pph01_70430 [Planotetraspora phitsanulokensis]